MTGNPVKLTSQITCPDCGRESLETMPENACQWFYDCKSCGALLKPKPGDCCVFCSYGTVPCPPIQEGEACCKSDVLLVPRRLRGPGSSN